jgi:hypothetical protein
MLKKFGGTIDISEYKKNYQKYNCNNNNEPLIKQLNINVNNTQIIKNNNLNNLRLYRTTKNKNKNKNCIHNFMQLNIN